MDSNISEYLIKNIKEKYLINIINSYIYNKCSKCNKYKDEINLIKLYDDTYICYQQISNIEICKRCNKFYLIKDNIYCNSCFGNCRVYCKNCYN